MVIIRLERRGKKNNPFYRIVATDSKKKIGGNSIETLGYWNPHSNEKEVNKSLIEKWVKKGAKVSPAVIKLIER